MFAKILQLYKKVTHNPYRERLKAAALASEVHAPSIVRSVSSTSVDDQIIKELQEARKEATQLLETLVANSEAERRRLEMIFNSLDDAVLVLDYSGKITDASLRARQLFKKSSKELCDLSLHDIFPDVLFEGVLATESARYVQFASVFEHVTGVDETNFDDAHNAYMGFIRSENTRLNSQIDAIHTRSDGHVLYVDLTVNILTLNAKTSESVCYVAVVNDRTNSKESDKELSRLKAFQDNILKVAHFPVYYKGSDLKFSEVNKAFTELLGLTATDVFGKTVSDVFHKDNVKALNALDQRTLASTELQTEKLDLNTPSGTLVDTEFSSKSNVDSFGVTSIAGSILIHSGLNSRIRASVFAAFSKSICFVDKFGIITGCNTEFVRLSGLSKTNVVGSDITRTPWCTILSANEHSFLQDTIFLSDTVYDRIRAPFMLDSGEPDGLLYVLSPNFDVKDYK